MPSLRCVHIAAGQSLTIPKGYVIHHSQLVEPSRGKPYFAVLLSKEPQQYTPAIGFHLTPDE